MEIDDFVDQRQAAVERFFLEYGEPLRRQGAIVASYRRRDGRRLGPYYKLACRVGKRQVAVYLGAADDFVREVRNRLAKLQEEKQLNKRIETVRIALRHQARVARRALDAELKQCGLHRQGNEVRGWRFAATS